MSRFNLVDEPWIRVIVDNRGTTELVSLLDLIENATQYKQFGGDMKIQDFAVLRFILAILQTVYSRFDSEDEIYEYLELDEQFIPQNDLSDYQDEYTSDLFDTWENLWKQKSFTSSVRTYLMKWYDHFYLYDEKYPIFQVTQEELSQFKLWNSAKKGSYPQQINGRTSNRTISESGNKISLFSSIEVNNKDIQTDDSIIRWLILFQGVIGTFDKANFSTGEKLKWSKGWLYDVGGISLNGENIFETLMLNLILVHPREDYQTNHQTPTWENNGRENIKKHLANRPLDNLSELYTLWGRAIVIDPNHEENNPFEMSVVKLPDVNHQNQFLEPMTLWRYNKNGENKETFTPRKHNISQAFWQSFGLVFPDDSEDDEKKRPILMDWLYNELKERLELDFIGIETFSMMDDANATSWMPTDEYYDQLKIQSYVLFDQAEESGWIDNIDNEINLTKSVIDKTLRTFYKQIMEVRNHKNTEIVNRLITETYDEVDLYFRDWLDSINEEDSKNKKVIEWRKILKKMIIQRANILFESATHRDFKGIEKDNRIFNIATIYNSFLYWLNKALNLEKEAQHGK